MSVIDKDRAKFMLTFVNYASKRSVLSMWFPLAS